MRGMVAARGVPSREATPRIGAPRLRQGTLEAAAGFWTISNSSTSNVMVAPGPILGGEPRSP